MTYIGRGSRGGGRAREIRVDGRRFQQRVNKKKVVFIEYGDCVIIAGLLGLYDKPAPRRHAAHNHVRARAACVPACPCTWNFLIWSDRPILWPESVSQPVRTLVPVLSLQASSDPRRTSSSKRHASSSSLLHYPLENRAPKSDVYLEVPSASFLNVSTLKLFDALFTSDSTLFIAITSLPSAPASVLASVTRSPLALFLLARLVYRPHLGNRDLRRVRAESRIWSSR